MITYYFTIKHRDTYIKITAETENIAKDVFLFLYTSDFEAISKQKPFGKKLHEEVNQRKTI